MPRVRVLSTKAPSTGGNVDSTVVRRLLVILVTLALGASAAALTAAAASARAAPRATECDVPGTHRTIDAAWRPDMAAAIAYAHTRAGDIAFAVRTQDRLYGYRPTHVEWSASMVKSMLLVAYLDLPSVADRPLEAGDTDLLTPMIEESDNDAADQVDEIVGGARLDALAHRAGMTQFQAIEPIWGESQVTGADLTRLFLHIDALVVPRHRAYAMHLLASITPSQRWGIGEVSVPGWTKYFKGGWGAGTGLIDSQVVLLKRQCARVSLAVLTMHDPSHAYGKQTLQGIFGRLLRGFPRVPAPSAVIRAATARAAEARVGALARAATGSDRVVVVEPDGHAVLRHDPALPATTLTLTPTPTPTPTPAPAIGGPRAPATAARHGGPTVLTVLAHLKTTGQITASAYTADRSAFDAALAEVKRLPADRADELDGVVENLHDMAVDGTLTAPRLPQLMLTLDRNRQYWRSGPLLVYSDRVEFAGSQLVWEEYPGQGLELQQLGSFGKANWYCTHGVADQGLCRTILSELVPLAVTRAGGLTWEYDFSFDGGAPPWVSAMAQGTALGALAHAYQDLHDPTYLTLGHSALSAFTVPPPDGVGVTTPLGMRFVQYTFQPGRDDEVINAFLQTLIGLHEYAQTSGDPLAARLFAEGDAEAEAELPSFNTGAWSLYQPGLEDDLSYHELVTGFLAQLCTMTRTPVYCTTAADFRSDLTTPPVLSLLTTRVRARHAAALVFTLSKISRVGIVVRRGTTVVFATSAPFPYGQHAVTIPGLRAGDDDTVTLDGTDLAGNYARSVFPLTVAR